MLKKNISAIVVAGVIALGLFTLSHSPSTEQYKTNPRVQSPSYNSNNSPIATTTTTKPSQIVVKKTFQKATTTSPTPQILNSDNQTPAPTIPISLEISSSTFKIDLQNNSSAYDLMLAAKEKNYLTFSSQKFGSLGYMITEINSIKNSTSDRKYWIYYINGAKAKIGLSNYTLNSGDIISWKYEDQE